MPTTFLRKWWMILIQGILMIIIGFIFFRNPAKMLVVISMWIGLLTLVTGILGVIAHFMTREEQDSGSLWWSIATLFLGILMVAKLGLTMKVITVVFGFWILITGIVLLSGGREYRKTGLPAWIMVLGGILSLIAGVVIIFNMAAGAIWISTLLAIQAWIAGIGLIDLAFIKRNLVRKVRSSFV